VTFRHLLTHRVGWGGFWDDLHSIRKSAQSMVQKPMTRKPGETYSYDNANFYMVRMLTEDLSGVPFEQFLDTRISRPLGITTLGGENPIPTLHYHNEGRKPGTSFVGDTGSNDWRLGADGAFASARDMAKLLVGLRQQRILAAQTMALMWPEDENTQHGLGWHVAYRGPEGVGWHHNGAWGDSHGNARTAIVHLPQGIDAVLLCNNAMVDPLQTLVEAYKTTGEAANSDHN